MRKSLVVALVFLATLLSSVAYAADPPPSSLELNIPDYEVTTIGSMDYVNIPGGDALAVEEFRPRVPFYTKSIDYPAGYRVQDVTLIERSALKTATGMNLPPVILSEYPPTPIELKSGWYPEEDFNWSLGENSDGSTTLTLVVYPFYYNPDTKESKFYKTYEFDIYYVVSTVSITEFTLDKSVYHPKEKVSIDIQLSNSGVAQDVIAATVIKQYGSDVVVDGLPLRLLRSLAGEASLSAEWDSSDFEQGYYFAEVTITDTAGNILDKDTAGFAIQTTEVKEQPSKFPTIPVVVAIVVVAAIIASVFIIRLRMKKVT